MFLPLHPVPANLRPFLRRSLSSHLCVVPMCPVVAGTPSSRSLSMPIVTWVREHARAHREDQTFQLLGTFDLNLCTVLLPSMCGALYTEVAGGDVLCGDGQDESVCVNIFASGMSFVVATSRSYRGFVLFSFCLNFIIVWF